MATLDRPLRWETRALRWPAPALLAWTIAALAWLGLGRLGADGAGSALAASAVPVVLLRWLPQADGPWRQGLVVGGFPLAALLLNVPVPAWVWGAGAAALMAAYPLRAWRDAPFFPTPPAALDGLAALLEDGPPHRVLDAGCGAGDGLLALRRCWPQAVLDGVEWSGPLALLARWRCARAGARIRRGDLWASTWGAHDLVYVFQRPESMERAWAKARAEMPPGAWLASLEFPVPGVPPQAVLPCPARRSLFLYRVPGPAAGAAAPASAGPSTAAARGR